MDASGDTTFRSPASCCFVQNKSILQKPKSRHKTKSGSLKRDVARNSSATATLESFRAPWVPAPGKSTSISSPGFIKQSNLEEGTSSSSIKSNIKTVSSRGTIFGPFGGKKSGKKIKVKKTRASNGYTLKTKDSLVDVTAFLQAKREEIMRLWEKHLPNCDSTLISQFEKANTLALDAAQEVDHLRQSIQNLHDKESSLSEEDCDTLERLRTQVLSKVKAFEEVNSQVHRMLSKSSVATITDEVQAVASRSTSKTRTFGIGCSVSAPEIIVLKEKSHYFSKDPYEESEVSEAEGISNVLPFSGLVSSTNANSIKTASTNPSSISVADLNKLTELYAERYDLPGVQGQQEFQSRGQVSASSLNKGRVRFVKFEKSEIHESEEEEEDGQRSHPKVEFYRNKVNLVQRKLMETEADVEELKGDLQRVESESNFQVRMLKSSFKDRIETLESFPEYLQITEKKLIDCMQSKVQLERILVEKDKEVKNLKEAGEKSNKELEDLKDRLRCFDTSKEFMTIRINDLEKSNDSFRRELEEKNKEISNLSKNLETSVHITSSTDMPKGHQRNDASNILQLSLENDRLRLKYGDLKERLEKSQKDIHVLQISKKKISIRLTRRQEELIQELEEARTRARYYRSQILLIKSTYHEMFPPEIWKEPKQNKKSSPFQSQKSTPRSKVQTTNQSVLDQLVDPNYVFEEPEVTKTITWVTGGSRGNFEPSDSDINETLGN